MFRCFRSTQGKIILGLVIASAIYLVVWHSMHLAAIAPFALLLACPLMHIFMHGSGHGGHGGHGAHASQQSTPDKET